MRTLNDQEKRTIRYASVGIAIYLAAFAGFRLWKFLDNQRAAYRKLTVEAQDLKAKVDRYQGKIAITKKLMETFHMDPTKLNKATVVGEASAAIQRTAREGGVQLGTVRESPPRPSSKELASLQLEGSGPVPAAMGWLNRLETCGFPVIIDSVQLSTDARTGQSKLSLTIIILDFEPVNKLEAPHA